MTQQEFAEAIGKSVRTVTEWVGGRDLPGRDALTKIADLGDVSVDWLLGREKPEGDIEQLLRDQKRSIDKFLEEQKRAGNITVVPDEDWVLIPVLDEYSTEGVPPTEPEGGYLAVPKQDIPEGCEHPFFLRVSREIADWGIVPEELLFVAEGMEAESGDIAVVRVEGACTVRRIEQAGEQIMLMSSNPGQSTVVDQGAAEIIGPVLWGRRYYRK